jgi:hypothetical protein
MIEKTERERAIFATDMERREEPGPCAGMNREAEE